MIFHLLREAQFGVVGLEWQGVGGERVDGIFLRRERGGEEIGVVAPMGLEQDAVDLFEIDALGVPNFFVIVAEYAIGVVAFWGFDRTAVVNCDRKGRSR